MMPPMLAKEVHYEGHVQGVGFRYATKRIAQGFDVRGWVKNLPDGRVEMRVVGEAEEVEDFLQAILDSSLGGNIRETHVATIPASDSAELRGFLIK